MQTEQNISTSENDRRSDMNQNVPLTTLSIGKLNSAMRLSTTSPLMPSSQQSQDVSRFQSQESKSLSFNNNGGLLLSGDSEGSGNLLSSATAKMVMLNGSNQLVSLGHPQGIVLGTGIVSEEEGSQASEQESSKSKLSFEHEKSLQGLLYSDGGAAEEGPLVGHLQHEDDTLKDNGNLAERIGFPNGVTLQLTDTSIIPSSQLMQLLGEARGGDIEQEIVLVSGDGSQYIYKPTAQSSQLSSNKGKAVTTTITKSKFPNKTSCRLILTAIF